MSCSGFFFVYVLGFKEKKKFVDFFFLILIFWKIQVQYLQTAVDVLSDCRKFLMNTYVFAYYLDKNNQSEIFEQNQTDLETATEKLSGNPFEPFIFT